jgi:hypothetical protein
MTDFNSQVEALDSSDSGQGPIVGSYEHTNEPSGFIQGGEFLDEMNDYSLLKKDSVQRRQTTSTTMAIVVRNFTLGILTARLVKTTIRQNF